jgi:hypothetical protein
MSEKEEITKICVALKKHRDILSDMMIDLSSNYFRRDTTYIIGFAVGRLMAREDGFTHVRLETAQMAVRRLFDECVQKI